MSVAELQSLRYRVLPMLQLAAAEYAGRVPDGYPVLIDTPERGAIGLQIDPSYSVIFTTDGQTLYAEYLLRQARTDTRSSASREKYSGEPFSYRRPLASDVSDQELRNVISELMSRYNFQPSLIHMTDT